jgi:phosphoadenosine phosphosulfate reductase
MSFQNHHPFADTERLIRSANRAHEMNMSFGHLAGRDLIEVAHRAFGGRLTLVSSFGTEAAVLLHLASQVDRNMAVTFIDTGRLFGETLRYRDALVERLGLTMVQSVRPDPVRVRALDHDLLQFRRDPGLCCHVRKVEPLQRALRPYDAWVTGRKRFQGGARASLPSVEAADGRIKFNPLGNWSAAEIEAHFAAHDLPRHPLAADGFLSVGCMPCTDRVAPGEDARAGRWRGQDKTECGIHTI